MLVGGPHTSSVLYLRTVGARVPMGTPFFFPCLPSLMIERVPTNGLDMYVTLCHYMIRHHNSSSVAVTICVDMYPVSLH
jgi:hypothetical protein